MSLTRIRDCAALISCSLLVLGIGGSFASADMLVNSNHPVVIADDLDNRIVGVESAGGAPADAGDAGGTDAGDAGGTDGGEGAAGGDKDGDKDD